MDAPTNSKEVLELIKEEKVEMVDLRFMDFPGLWQHFSVPVREIDEDTFEAALDKVGRAQITPARLARAPVPRPPEEPTAGEASRPPPAAGDDRMRRLADRLPDHRHSG